MAVFTLLIFEVRLTTSVHASDRIFVGPVTALGARVQR